MKPSAYFIALQAFLLTLPEFVHSSPSPPADSLHYCLPFDFDQWQQEPPAAKRMADRDVGEPRTVRMIYFLPNDRSYQAGVVDSMKTTIRRLQTFYAGQMHAHGHGEKTFRFETDDQGEPLVHRVDGQHPDSHYLDDTMATVLEEIIGIFDLTENVYLVVIDNSIRGIGSNGSTSGGIATSRGKTGGVAVFSEEFRFALAAHELTHAFGLKWHDFRKDEYILSYGYYADRLSDCSAGFLAVHPYFNPAVEAQAGPVPAIERVSPVTYPGGAESVFVELKVNDPDGLHQVFLFVLTDSFFLSGTDFGPRFLEVKACRAMAGEEEAVVEFDFDGSRPSNVSINLSNSLVHPITVMAVDTGGNAGWTSFDLRELSAQHVATLTGVGEVRSVSFSTDGKSLASATENGVEVRDVETRQDLAFLEQTGEVRSVAFTSDGTKLASGSTDGTIELWETAAWSNIATLESQDPISSVAFSPDGTTVAAGTSEEIELWDVESGTHTVTFEGPGARTTSVSFSPNGTTLASGSEDRTVRIWDVAAGTHTATLEGHSQRVLSVAFSPDGTLASGSGDGTVKLWDVSSQTNTATLSRYPGGGTHSGGVTSISFSPDGETLASGSWDNTAKLWDVLTEKEVATLSGHTGGITSVAFSPDGSMLASGSLDNTIKLWDASQRFQPRPRKLVKVSGDNQEESPGSDLADPLVVEVRDQYGNPLQDIPVTFSIRSGGGKLGGGRFREEVVVTDPDGLAQSILTLGPNPAKNTVEATVPGLEPVPFHSVGVGPPETLADENYPRWHLPDGAVARLGKGRLSQSDRAIAFSQGGKRLAAVSAIGIWVYDTATFRPQAFFPTSLNRFGSLGFSPDGILAFSGADGERMTRLWDPGTGEVITTLEDTRSSPVFSPDGNILATRSLDGTIKLWDVETGEEATTLKGNTVGGYVLAFSPDGSILASGWGDHALRLWNLETGETMATLEGLADVVESLAFSPDGTLLASGSRDGTVQLWDVGTGTNSILGRSGWVKSVAFSPDGNILASASAGAVMLWDVATETNTAILKGRGSVSCLAFSPDGTLASGSWAGGTIMLWDLTTGRAAILEGHRDGFRSVAFSPDGTTLASSGSANSDRTIMLWEVATGLQTGLLDGHKTTVGSVAFSPDGKTLASGSGDRTIKLWEVATGANSATLEENEWISAVAFSPDGATLASGSGGTVKLWDVAARTITLTLGGHRGGVGAVAFSPDGNTLASSAGYHVKLWDVATGTLSATLETTPEGEWAGPRPIAFSPDGRILAFYGYWRGKGRRAVRLWDVGSRQPTAILEGGHTNQVTSLAFSPDGTFLASGSWDQTLRLWDLGTRSTTAVFDGHTHDVLSVAFSPDGTILASASRDGTVLLWDTTPWVPRYVPPDPETVIEVSRTLPAQTALLANYPNPFNPKTWIPYQLQAPARVHLTIYDVRGAVVRTLDLGNRPAGRYLTPAQAANWDGRDQRGDRVASGVYFYRLQAGGVAHVRRMVLVK